MAAFLLGPAASPPALAAEPGPEVTIDFFWSTSCPHCKREMAFLEGLKARHPGLLIIPHEVSANPEEAALLIRLSEAFGTKVAGVPATFVGDNYPIFGYRDARSTGAEIETRVRECIERNCPEPTERLSAGAPLGGAQDGGLLLGGAREEADALCTEDFPCIEEGGP